MDKVIPLSIYIFYLYTPERISLISAFWACFGLSKITTRKRQKQNTIRSHTSLNCVLTFHFVKRYVHRIVRSISFVFHLVVSFYLSCTFNTIPNLVIWVNTTNKVNFAFHSSLIFRICLYRPSLHQAKFLKVLSNILMKVVWAISKPLLAFWQTVSEETNRSAFVEISLQIGGKTRYTKDSLTSMAVVWFNTGLISMVNDHLQVNCNFSAKLHNELNKQLLFIFH